MTHNLNIGCKRILALSIAMMLAAPYVLYGVPPTKPTTWTITVDISGNGDKPQYQLKAVPDADHGGCASATPTADPHRLYVCANDSINWKGKSAGGKHELVIFMADQVLTVNSNARATFRTSDDDNTTDTGVVSAPPSTQAHEWYVAIFDKTNNKMYSDDPQIIVGTGSYEVPQLVNEIANQAQQLTLLLPGNREVKKLLKDSEALKKQLLIKK